MMTTVEADFRIEILADVEVAAAAHRAAIDACVRQDRVGNVSGISRPQRPHAINAGASPLPTGRPASHFGHFARMSTYFASTS